MYNTAVYIIVNPVYYIILCALMHHYRVQQGLLKHFFLEFLCTQLSINDLSNLSVMLAKLLPQSSLEQRQADHICMEVGNNGVMMVTAETHLAVYLIEYLMQNCCCNLRLSIWNSGCSLTEFQVKRSSHANHQQCQYHWYAFYQHTVNYPRNSMNMTYSFRQCCKVLVAVQLVFLSHCLAIAQGSVSYSRTFSRYQLHAVLLTTDRDI